MSAAQFRRPAMLEPGDAEQIIGGVDPAETCELAHATARVLMGRETGAPIDTRDQMDLRTLVDVVQSQGVDIVSELWASSPATTLPGTLWRLYLIGQWWERDPDTVELRIREGANALAEIDENQVFYLAKELRRGITAIMAGHGCANFAGLLRAAGALIRIMAEGTTFGANWITDRHDELADHVTVRNAALRATGSELVAAARREENGELD